MKVDWRRFKQIWTVATWQELGTLSYLALITSLVQVVIFFWLMHDWPGMTNYFAWGGCDEIRYISENIELNKGKASVMIATMLPSWVVLGIINAYEMPLREGEVVRWFSRPLVNFFAVIAYAGCVGVVLYDQQRVIVTSEQRRQHDMHISSAFVMSFSYVWVHFLTCRRFRKEFMRLGPKYLHEGLLSVLRGDNTILLYVSVVNIGFLALYCGLYVLEVCDRTVVYFEYALYLSTAAFNALVYLQFSVVHVLAKIDYESVFTQVIPAGVW